MRYLLIIITFTLIFCNNSFSQVKKCGEVGFSVGGSFYLGDVNKVPFKSPRIGGGIFYRHTFDTRYAVRGSLNYLNIAGKDSKSNDEFQQARNHSFKQMIFEANAAGEFNFMPFLPANPKYDYSPYVHAGMGAGFLPNGEKNYILTIPFGVGVKYNMNRDFTISAEGSFYKTFTDHLDGFEKESTENYLYKQRFYEGNMDWFSFFSIKMAYKIKYKMKCPAFD